MSASHGAGRVVGTGVRFALIVLLSGLFGVSPGAFAQVLFSDDFESDLSQWPGYTSGTHTAEIVPDPQQPDNALGFSAPVSGGDAVSADSYDCSNGCTLSFDFLEFDPSPQAFGSGDGWIGYAVSNVSPGGLGSGHVWLAGETLAFGATMVLPDDGKWHRCEIGFTPGVTPQGAAANYPPGPIYIIAEDNQLPLDDTFLDNIVLEVGLPAESGCAEVAVVVPTLTGRGLILLTVFLGLWLAGITLRSA